jgi:SPP1 family predicted phage head-tail adaptor
MINIGKLNRRVTIKSLGTTQDALGEIVQTWSDLATVWASITDLTGKEFIAAGSTQNSVTTKIGIRYLSTVKSTMRVYYGTDIYNIEAVLGQDKKSLVLMCSRG